MSAPAEQDTTPEPVPEAVESAMEPETLAEPRPAEPEPAAVPATAVESAMEPETLAEPEPAAEPEPEPGQAPGRPGRRRWQAVAALGIVAAALVGLVAYLGDGYLHARARTTAEREVLTPAKAAAARILSYDYRHIQQDAASGAAVLTGDFRIQYETVMRQQVVPQAPKQRAVVQADVVSAGVSGVNANGSQAVVLVFANQTVSNVATSQPRIDQVRVRLTLDRIAGRWLVSKVDAI